jgi:hypothetical protein
MTIDTSALLQWDAAGQGEGLPWGLGTHMAAREQNGLDPWVKGCSVQVMIGGEPVMNAIRDQLEGMITAALASPQPPGARGFVYITDWRMNGQRDLSEANAWGTNPWDVTNPAVKDQTVLGLLMRLIYAGVRVRIMLWMPVTPPVGLEELAAGWPHIHDHVWIAAVIGAANQSALSMFGSDKVVGGNLGVVALDARVTPSNGAHHQKTVLIRGGQSMVGADGNPIAVAFINGVDLAFTRRDAPGQMTTSSGVQFQDGDWQSASTIPDVTQQPLWPQGPSGADYGVLKQVAHLNDKQAPDLYTAVYGDSSTQGDPSSPPLRQIWHDQNLVIRGPMVGLIEGQFVDRWMDAGDFHPLPGDGQDLSQGAKISFGMVTLSAASEIQDSATLTPLPEPVEDPELAGGTSTLQMWRTIPARLRSANSAYPDKHSLYNGGEFTVMAGYVQAATAAQHLIWIFDQYFWSLPYAQLINQLVNDPSKPDLNVIVILPPYADIAPSQTGGAFAQHKARQQALNALVGIPASDRVSVWNLWDRRSWRTMAGQGPGLGIYVHAKAQTYDASLLVCGSANINKRSLLGDTEIAVAVLDPSVVAAHLHDRWNLLFPGQAWPNDPNTGQPIDLDQPVSGVGPGTAFHAEFKQAASASTSFLIPDQWTVDSAVLPNGVQKSSVLNSIQYNMLLSMALECSSLPDRYVAREVRDGFGGFRPPTLAEVSENVEQLERYVRQQERGGGD